MPLFLQLHMLSQWLSVTGDISFALSFPVLWLRMYITGSQNISLVTHLMVFAALCFDLVDKHTPLRDTPLLAAWNMLAATGMTLFVAHRSRFQSQAGVQFLSIFVASFAGWRLYTGPRLHDYALGVSLSGFTYAWLPQMQMLDPKVTGKAVDAGMRAYLALVFAWRACTVAAWGVACLAYRARGWPGAYNPVWHGLPPAMAAMQMVFMTMMWLSMARPVASQEVVAERDEKSG